MKILALGDSFTYGSELPDCDEFAPGFGWNKLPPPSSLSYPALVADTLGATLTNLSMPGGSNSRIYRLAVDAVCKEKYDIVICGWTEIARMDLQFANKDTPASANTMSYAHKKFPWLTSYYKLHYNDIQAYQTWLAQVIGLQSYFKSINQQYVFASIQGLPAIDSQFNHLVGQVDKDHYIGWPRTGMTEWMGDCPKGPRGHPLESGHQRIAEKINEHITSLGCV